MPTKTDLISIYSRINDLMQELTDYSEECEEGSVLQLALDNCIDELSNASGYLENAPDMVNF